mgnify:CR=1 FL=1
MPLFDTHAHLDDDRFSSDLETIIEGFAKETNNRVLWIIQNFIIAKMGVHSIFAILLINYIMFVNKC